MLKYNFSIYIFHQKSDFIFKKFSTSGRLRRPSNLLSCRATPLDFIEGFFPKLPLAYRLAIAHH